MNNLEIKVSVTLNQLKLLQDGAAIASENFNRTHPKHGYVQHDKHISIEQFLDWAIRDKYDAVYKEKLLLDSSSS